VTDLTCIGALVSARVGDKPVACRAARLRRLLCPPSYAQHRPRCQQCRSMVSVERSTGVHGHLECTELGSGALRNGYGDSAAELGCAGKRVLHQLNHAIVEAVPPVYHAGQSRASIGEQEEVMAYELHLVERIVDGHGRGRVPLTSDDATWSVPIR
jgi:hypothetical protein